MRVRLLRADLSGLGGVPYRLAGDRYRARDYCDARCRGLYGVTHLRSARIPGWAQRACCGAAGKSRVAVGRRDVALADRAWSAWCVKAHAGATNHDRNASLDVLIDAAAAVQATVERALMGSTR
jgi:hypothetical protein